MIQIEESGITRSRRSPISLKSLQQALHIEEVPTHYTVAVHNTHKIIIFTLIHVFDFTLMSESVHLWQYRN